MNKLKAPRPLLVDSPSESGFATTSWGEQARPRVRAAETEGRLVVLLYRGMAEPLQQLQCRNAYLREEGIDIAGNEQPEAH